MVAPLLSPRSHSFSDGMGFSSMLHSPGPNPWLIEWVIVAPLLGHRSHIFIYSAHLCCRFYVERKSKFVLLIEHCVDLLRSLPSHTLPVSKLKESLNLPEPSSRKLLKNQELLRSVKKLFNHPLLLRSVLSV